MTDMIEHGAEPTGALLDETGLNVNKLSLNGKRDYTRRKDGETKAVVYMRGENPRLEGSLSGEPIRNGSGALQGLALVSPGTANALLNLPNGVTVHGFAFTSTTKVIVLDVSTEKSDEEEDKITVPFEFWPSITTYDSATS